MITILGVSTLCASTLLAGCHSSAAQRAVSPLIGTWRINGAVPQPQPDMPQFTQLTFRRDGTLDASYVAAGGALAGVIKSAPKVRQEQDSYTPIGKRRVRIIEGSRSLSYSYDVRDEKLFLRSPDSDTPTVFVKVDPAQDSDSSDGASTSDQSTTSDSASKDEQSDKSDVDQTQNQTERADRNSQSDSNNSQ